ncbi:RHS repeat domain-containing protein [Pseudomonas sp. NPDC086112]|uniref:RHS repeat domain-containing protein n=1 Tax=Pseudomonas sp. NPDC086112 TaxID=3364430 RepID=UPI00381BE198
MNARLHNKTPTINALDSRGLPVRQVTYWRANADDSAQARITSQDHDLAGRVIAQRDPRLFGKFAKANLTTLYSLSGRPLRVDSVDAGWRLNLPGDAGQTLRNWDQRGNHWRTTFDNQLRPITIQEESPGQSARIIERFSYGDNSIDSAALNRCGLLIRHDDEAGTLLIDEYSLGGKPSCQTRHFLSSAETLDWPAEEHSRNLLRETGDGYKTQWHYDATGEVIRQVDAGQHQQRFSFDVAGRLKTVSLKLKDTEIENTLVKDLVYNAFGQVESQTAGNNVMSRAVFDPASGRLTSMTASVSNRTWQSLHYSYDAVGNVTQIEDKAQPVQFGSNQRVEAVSTFIYDSLYQLTSATGREAAGTTTAPHIPALGITPIDTRQLFNFTQHYTYDAGGNLTELRHVRDRNNYTRTFNVANLSNRLVSWRQGSELPGTATTFDDSGNLQDLQSGQSLQWNAHNQLTRVVLVKREDGPDDHERYDYDGSGQRLRKTTTTQGASITHTREVRYLPGIEIRTRGKERLEVITVQAGRGSVRCLHWTEGQPSGIPADQLRYSLDDHLGSSSLELDGNGDLISQESYFPFGGTAWTASRSKVEADYRTIRYSGKERDASGLYYYGARYYAPWLQRWISPDPTGAVDGLNLYCMVGNNPLRYIDYHGTQKDEAAIKEELGTYSGILSEVNKRVGTLNHQLYNSMRKRDIVKRLFQSYGYNAVRHVMALGAGLLAAPTGPMGIVGAAVATSLTTDSLAGKFNATRHLPVAMYPQTRRLEPDDIEYTARTAFYDANAKLQHAKEKDLNPRNTIGQKNLSVMATSFVLTKMLEVKGAWIPNFESSTQATKALDGLPGQKIERLNNELIELDNFLEHDAHAINAAFDELGVDEFYAAGVKGRLGRVTDRMADRIGVKSSSLISRSSIQSEIAISRATIQRGRELLFRLNEHNKSQGKFFI